MKLLPEALLRPILSRNEIMGLTSSTSAKTIKLAVHRNHGFELVASVLNAFLAPSNLQATFFYSAYDDSLSLNCNFPEIDAHIVWLDGNRYRSDPTEHLLKAIKSLQVLTKRPVLVATLNLDLPEQIGPEIKVCPLDAALSPLGGRQVDLRLAKYSGTRLSNLACLEAARYFGLHWLPEIFLPHLKAIAVDLDNTLYAGVLAEDGLDSVQPYLDVQKELKKLKDQGLMLTLLSKNEEADVRNLFKHRSDFLLSFEDFAGYAISWNPKSEGLIQLAKDLNIGKDAFLFVDDNVGELLQMAQSLPEVHLLAAANSESTVQGLRHYPGLRKSTYFSEDRLRTQDIKAQKDREKIFQTMSVEDYRRELKISLTFTLNPISRLERVTELLNKTNQFIFTYLRPQSLQVQEYMSDKNLICVTGSLEDKLSASGLIAILLARKKNQILHVDELTISCRALGRNLETGLIFKMLKLACESLNCNRISLTLVEGSRNRPARIWLKDHWPKIQNQTVRIEDFKDQLEGVEVKIA